MLSGDNGILQQTTNARTKTIHASVLEQMQLEASAYTVDKTTGKYSNSLIDYLKSKLIISDISGEEDKWLINVTTLLGSNQSMGKGTYPNDVYILEKQDTSTGSVVNTKVATTTPIRIAATSTSQVTYKVVYYGNDTSESINLGTLTDENKSNNNDLAKLTTDFKNMDEGEFSYVLFSENDYEIMTITDYDENDMRYYYIKYNGTRYKITIDNSGESSLVSNVEEYKDTLKDVTYAITNDIDIEKGYTRDIHEFIENIYDLEDIHYTSNDENIATIDSNGIIRGISIGETTITLKGVNTGKTKEINVTVSQDLDN